MSPDQHTEPPEHDRHYHLVFERNPIPMWVYDDETLRFLAVNDAAVVHYGWSREEFLAMSIFGIRPADDLDLAITRAIEKAKST